jgi:hypothetical protein
MRTRSFLVLTAFLTVLAAAPGSQASSGKYLCRSSEAVAASTDVQDVVGPSCGFVVSCPTTATTCYLQANATAYGVGVAGVTVEIAGAANAAYCANAASCQTADAVKVLARGDEVGVWASWGSGTLPASAAVAAGILLQATRTDN